MTGCKTGFESTKNGIKLVKGSQLARRTGFHCAYISTPKDLGLKALRLLAAHGCVDFRIFNYETAYGTAYVAYSVVPRSAELQNYTILTLTNITSKCYHEQDFHLGISW